MAFKDESSTFLGEVGVRERVNWRRSGTVLLAALAVFGVSSFSARALFPRGVKGRVPPSSTEQAMEVVPPAKDFAIGNEAEGLSTLAPVHVTTAECTAKGDSPVLSGVDVVAYFSLEDGHPAVLGSAQYATVYHDYIFYFSSFENQLMFEDDPLHFLPAWGGFCSYGISKEIVWNADNLGPASNPDYWLIMDDTLYLFRSSVPKTKFEIKTAEYIAHGDAMWRNWFTPPGEHDNEFTPFNTACFCSPESCVDA